MSNHEYYVDDELVEVRGKSTLEWIDDTFFTIHFLGKSFNGEVIEANLEDHKLTVKVNHRTFEVRKKQPLDDLIKALGLDKKKAKKLHQLQSPMPGRVLSFAVEVGEEVSEGTPLLTLEAMKMENVIKAEGMGIVKKLAVDSDSVVDKGALLIEFE